MALTERRDLQRLVVVTASGHEAVCPKGGVPNARGGIDVPVRYREQPLFAVSLPYNADAKAVRVAVKARAEAVDDMLAAQEAEAKGQLDEAFADLQEAYADLAAGKTTEEEVRRKLAERLGLSVQAATAREVS